VVDELEAQYENEKKEQDLANKQREIAYLRKSNRLFVWLIVLAVFVALLVVLLLVNRSRQIHLRAKRELELEKKDRELALARKKEIEMELEFKKKELTQLALHISNQNEFLESFRDNLKDASDEQQLKTLERELESKITLDKQREAFDMNIDLIHEDFFRKLKDKFPTLTENEKKLCAMLRLNLSSKEIASILNISVKSVEMNRYRLRKKLQLSGEEDLVSFLSTV
jgi:DNA-binding CsgD family transcriptional regulator